MELRDKLRLAHRGSPVRGRPRRARHAAGASLGLGVQERALGRVHVRETSWPLRRQHGRHRLGEAAALDGAALCRLAPELSPAQLRDLAFVDVETTGLAGGTGTYAFLVGVGTFDGALFVLRQYFLAGLEEEPAMLASVAEDVKGRPGIVSFNGRRFDLPLLLTRLTLNRLPEIDQGVHVDLLYPARRLYGRRLLSCTLASLEAHVLGVRRNGDVPGALVPSIYFDYLRSGVTAGLAHVFEHNALDVLSLVTLLARVGQVCGGSAPLDADDWLALARWDTREGRLARAAIACEAALHSGTEEARSRARRHLAWLYRRLGRRAEARSVWEDEAHGGSSDGRLEALVELAKVAEHQRRDFVAAEELTKRALSIVELAGVRGSNRLPPVYRRPALEHRLGRLRRRLASARNGKRATLAR